MADRPPRPATPLLPGLGLVAGAGVGSILALLLGDEASLGLGIAVGAAVGLVIGALLDALWSDAPDRGSTSDSPMPGGHGGLHDRAVGWLGFLGFLGFLAPIVSPLFLVFFAFFLFFTRFTRSSS